MRQINAITFNQGMSWKAVVKQILQEPDFKTQLDAFAWARKVLTGETKALPHETVETIEGGSTFAELFFTGD